MSIKAPSRYLQKKFLDCFDQGCLFWTSEDGCPCEWVIARIEDWRVWFNDWAHDQRYLDEEKTLATMRAVWVYREWSGTGDDGYFDGGGRPGKIWRLSDTETPFPVFAFDPIYFPKGERP